MSTNPLEVSGEICSSDLLSAAAYACIPNRYGMVARAWSYKSVVKWGGLDAC